MENVVSQLKNQLVKLKEERKKEETLVASSCKNFDNNLSYGLTNNDEVKCLQSFLKLQGTDIYPEGLVTGNFLSLTRKAVIRFQDKYSSEILEPIGLKKGTGFVGPMTRKKINDILGAM